jgi:benzoyl-CoA reductase subunit D
MIAAGIDCGAKNTKTIILQDRNIIGKGGILTGFRPAIAAESSLAAAIADAGINRTDIQKVCITGAGKDVVKIVADRIDDIQAISKGGHYFFTRARTVVDVGAEEGRAAKIDESGNPIDFVLNEKCAAGAGAFVEAMARALEVSIEEMGPLSLQSGRQIPMNAQCVIFAESEVVSLIHAGTSKSDISKAIHDSISSRIVSMIRRIGLNPDLVLIGGLACNPGFLAALKKELALDEIYVPDDPAFGAAVGAAAAAAETA